MGALRADGAGGERSRAGPLRGNRTFLLSSSVHPRVLSKCLVARPIPRWAQAAFLPVTASSSSPRAMIMRPTWLRGPANCILRGSN